MSITDCDGAPLAEGAHVRAWWDGVEYTATVVTIRSHIPGCGGHRHVVLIRDDDGTVAYSTSDAVKVISDKEGAR